MNIKYWKEAKRRIAELRKIDRRFELVFGSKGHEYEIFDTVSEKEIESFENKYDVRLPEEYRIFLMHFGAGGPGPDYGIYDFRKINPHNVSERFTLTESTEWPEDDDNAIYKLPGLLNISTSGCAIDWYLEVNGPQLGTMWVDSGPGLELTKTESFSAWYTTWLDRIEVGLRNYVVLQKMSNSNEDLKKIEETLGIKSYEFKWDGIKYHRFRGIPGRLRCVDGQVVSFDIGTCWIE